MANVLPSSGFFKLSVVCLDGAQVSINSFYYRVGSGPSTATDADAASDLDLAIAPYIKPILNNNAQYRGVIVQILNSVGVPITTATASVANAGAGTAGATAMGKQLCGLTGWYTSLPHQKNRGRTYWPFPATASDTGDGVPTAGYTAALTTLAGQLLGTTSIVVGGRSSVVQLSLFHRKVPGFTDLVAHVERGVWATQRRRGAYGRGNASPI